MQTLTQDVNTSPSVKQLDGGLLAELQKQSQETLNILEYFERNEKGDAELFAKLYRGQVVYDHHSGEWYIKRHGQFYELDRTREVYGYVQNRVASEYIQASKDARLRGDKQSIALSKEYFRRAQQLLSKKRVDAVLFLAANEPGIALTGDEWDLNPDLLAVDNGVIDLRTQAFRDCLPTEYIRTRVPVAWLGAGYGCPVWKKTLRDIFNGDDEMIACVQRVLGYAITGHTIEHTLPIFFGEGRNGKSTLIETIREVLGNDICMTAQADVLMDIRRAGDSPQPFQYGLRGKRLACVSESKEGQKINLGLLKLLTGGDTLNVRTLHSKPVTFRPTHKLILISNHKPRVPADETAAWDRLLLFPFTMRFVDHPTKANELQQDKTLREKLRAEYPGILAWLVAGALAWREQGINPPATVLTATRDYQQEEDEVGQFLEECCIEGEGLEVKAGDLYKHYQAWATNYGPNQMSQRSFGTRMKPRYLRIKKTPGMFYQGLGLNYEQ